MFTGYGSPLAARQDFSIYYVFFMILGVILLFLLINFFILQLRKNNISSSVKKGSKLTVWKDVIHLGKSFNLKKEEMILIYELCRENKVPNIFYNIAFKKFSDQFFETQYDYLKVNEKKLPSDEIENKISLLFTIRRKIEARRHTLSKLTSTINIPAGSKLCLIESEKEQYETKLVTNSREGMVVNPPKDLFGSEIQFKPLSKVLLLYQTTEGEAYISEVRIIRNQIINEVKSLVISHSNNMKSYKKRKSESLYINKNCVFSAVKATTGGKGRSAQVNYIPTAKKFDGKMLELSPGGCSIETNLSIRSKQYIYIEIVINAKEPENMIGFITATRKTPDKINLILDIIFVRITKKVRNEIFSKIYDFVT